MYRYKAQRHIVVCTARGIFPQFYFRLEEVGKLMSRVYLYTNPRGALRDVYTTYLLS